jgi:hypothetical protein
MATLTARFFVEGDGPIKAQWTDGTEVTMTLRDGEASDLVIPGQFGGYWIEVEEGEPFEAIETSCDDFAARLGFMFVPRHFARASLMFVAGK